jgi:glycosyltransferase involved in cell wall biosynthesis
MRIVYLHQYFVTPNMVGGTRSYEMARRLVAKGHEVHMVTTNQDSKQDHIGTWRTSIESGIHVHWAAVPYNNRMAFGERIWAFCRFAYHATIRAGSLKPDLVFATSTPLTIAIPAVLASRRVGCPMVFEVRDLWPAVPIAIGVIRNPLLKAAARWLERFAYWNAVHVVALAPGMKEEILKLGYPEARVSVIPNGCDFDLYGNVLGESPRNEFGWLADRPLLLFCGTFGLVNGVDYLPKLALAMRKVDPEVCIVAIGAGREYERVVAMAQEAGVYERNLFLLGALPKTETARWLAAADMTIALFTGPEIVWRDAVQNKFFDSIAAGCPVVNNFPGWQARIAAEAGAGLIVSGTDVVEAARDIVAALRDESWMAAARCACKKLAQDRFDRNKLADGLAAVLLNAKQASAADGSG